MVIPIDPEICNNCGEQETARLPIIDGLCDECAERVCPSCLMGLASCDCPCPGCGDGDLGWAESGCIDDMCYGGDVPCMHGDYAVIPCGLCGRS